MLNRVNIYKGIHRTSIDMSIIYLYKTTHLCPSSCVIVCANVIPLSSFTEHDLSARHIPATFATPVEVE